MKVFALLLAVAQAAPSADPALVYAGVPVHHGLVYGAALHTGNAVPVAVGGYKAEAGDNGELKGAVHEVPGLVPALALATQESASAKLTTGTGALLPALHYYGKREAEPAVVGLPYAHLPYALPAVVPATQALTYKTITPTVETNVVATNAAVPVAVGGYKAVAGDNGELKGAVHEVPAVFGAPALNSQVNDASQGSLTVGTSAIVTHTAGEPIVKEHTVNVPVLSYGGIAYGKREAEADPYYGYGYGLGYGGYGYGLRYGLGYGYGHGYGYYG